MTQMRHAARAAAVAVALVCALDTCSTQANVIDLSQAQLQVSEAPPGFHSPIVKLHHHYVDSIDAEYTLCDPLGLGLSVTRWKEGQIQLFQAKDPYKTLTVCSYLLESARDARATYDDLEGHVNTSLSMGAKRIVIKPKLGDRASAVWDVGQTEGGKPVPIWRLAFQHGLAVVFISVDRPPKGFKSANLIRLGTLINARLH